MKRLRSQILFALAALLLASAGELGAQTLTSMDLHKQKYYVQTSATSVVPNPSGTTYSFDIAVRGTGLATLSPAPTISGPINTALLGSAFNGVLAYSPQESAWVLHYPYTSVAAMDARFGSGTYTVTVNGTPVALQLSGDAYPDPVSLTFSQGTWADGKFYFDPSRPLTITTTPFTTYSTTKGVIFMGLDVNNGSHQLFRQGYPADPSNVMSATLAANSYAAGEQVNGHIHLVSTVNENTTAIPGVYTIAAYDSFISFTMVAAPPPQVFPMTVTPNIGVTVANATATFQPRPQDVGTTASVFVFAVAPSNRVLNATQNKAAQLAWKAEGSTRDTPVQCVLAQLNSSGQLTAVSASSLQAYVTGTLSAQGQAVTLLSGVPTANIGGATFYLGYGANASAMINNGINQRAVAIPGDITCDPKAPKTGWWWSPGQDGRGYSIEVAGNHIFFASYLYDLNGRATWYVGSGNTSLDGSLFTGNLEAYSRGQTLGGSYRVPTAAVSAGSLTLAFADATHGTMIWPGGSVAIERFNIVPNGTTMNSMSNQPEVGWWWNPEESGRGYFLEWQGGELFMAGYMYDDSGDPIWYLSTNTTPSTNLQGYTGAWWRYGNGQTLSGPYKPATRVDDNVAPVTITFSGAENAIMTLPGGRTTNIRRFRF